MHFKLTWGRLYEDGLRPFPPVAETRQNLSDLLTGAIREYATHKRARPVVLNHIELSIAENGTAGKCLAPAGRVAFLCLYEVLAIHNTLLERFGNHAKKTGFGTTGPNPVPGLFQTALVERLNKHMPYIRSKRSFCITLVHAATKSLTNLSCASSAA